MIEFSTIIQALHYLLKTLGRADKIKLIKLLYLADKYHLIHYERTITNDDYYAMELGPVGTTVKDILSRSSFLSNEEKRYSDELIDFVDSTTFAPKDVSIKYEMLSDSDKEALDFVLDRFGNKTQWELSEYTHKYPEWLQYRDLFSGGHIKRERLSSVELLSVLENDPIAEDLEDNHLEKTKELISGRFE